MRKRYSYSDGESRREPGFEKQVCASSKGLFILILVFTLSTTSPVSASASDSPKTGFGGIIQQLSSKSRIRTTLTQCTPALRPTISSIIEGSNCENNHRTNRRHSLRNHNAIQTVSSVKVKANKTKERIRNILEFTGCTGFYYGLDPDKMVPQGGFQRKPRPPKLEDSMGVALEELKMLRLEMERMRKEITQLKRKMIGDEDDDSIAYVDEETKQIALQKRRQDAERLAAEIEAWATRIFQEGEEDGWVPVDCSKMIRSSMNRMERTTAFMKWMADPRGDKADKEDQTLHPCIKCSSTIDAPLEMVCTYLSQPEVSSNYNDVIDNFKDLEDISPNAKICWASSPQILFVKPRDFITFCHHRWKKDGSQVIVNQACEHPKYPLKKMEKEGKSCRGYALRGANILSRDPEDPSKTKIDIIAHCRPGGGLPDWATKTAVKALAPIEPFKLFHKINDQVLRNANRLEKIVQESEQRGSNMPPGRSSKPGGFAQIGYACFWPNGGGKKEQADDSSADSLLDGEGNENAPVNGEMVNQ
mmetsp:Transcript_13788/g.34650  ORF Transcript_13788/g.34650 Transcript_13788/m.34650 type:complete len:532 (+) Transcript_13788:259-1854(+)